MRRYLKDLKPSGIEDIIAMVALFRPGPMELIPDYIGRKFGWQPIQYLHPKLEPILKNTYGIPVYQEQILQIARDLAGYTLGEADVLRKAIGKKIKELMHSERAKFIEKAMKNGVAQTIAEKIFNFIEPFAGYSFNRSHAACYALIGYQTAYLKANYPLEFMTALMNAEQGDIERIAILIQECKQMGIEVLAPDINESKKNFTIIPDKNQIRFGLLAIKNVGENIVKTITEERKTNGPFGSIANFAERIQSKDLNKKSMESLIKAGAFDALGERNELLHNLERILYANREIAKTKSAGQTGLFGTNILPASFKMEGATAASKHEKLMWEKELLGLYISSHPLEDFQGKFRGNVTEIKTISQNQAGEIVRVGAVISTIKKILTKAGQPMLFCTIEDLSGRIETLVFPSTLQKFPTSFQENGVIMLKARVTDKDGMVKLICEDVRQIA
jgi:DNA polymerase-3 subunit alpha